MKYQLLCRQLEKNAGLDMEVAAAVEEEEEVLVQTIDGTVIAKDTWREKETGVNEESDQKSILHQNLCNFFL